MKARRQALILELIDRDPPSGRYRAADLLDRDAAENEAETEAEAEAEAEAVPA